MLSPPVALMIIYDSDLWEMFAIPPHCQHQLQHQHQLKHQHLSVHHSDDQCIAVRKSRTCDRKGPGNFLSSFQTRQASICSGQQIQSTSTQIYPLAICLSLSSFLSFFGFVLSSFLSLTVPVFLLISISSVISNISLTSPKNYQKNTKIDNQCL